MLDESVHIPNAELETSSLLWLFRVHGIRRINVIYLLQGVKRGVLGTHFKVYLQYYYHTLVIASQRKEVKRTLDVTNLAFLTCVAAFGYGRGCTEFDNARKSNDVNAVNCMVIDRTSFLTFFWTGNFDSFSLCGCWQHS